MYYSFADGRELNVPDMCGYCQMTTGGAHELHCPLYEQSTYQDLGQFYLGGEVRKLSYPDHVAINKLLANRHPEWGIREI